MKNGIKGDTIMAIKCKASDSSKLYDEANSLLITILYISWHSLEESVALQLPVLEICGQLAVCMKEEIRNRKWLNARNSAILFLI